MALHLDNPPGPPVRTDKSLPTGPKVGSGHPDRRVPPTRK